MFSVYYQNVRGVNTKINTIFSALHDSEYDVLAFTESWLQSGVNSAELIPSYKYNTYRKDRNLDVTNKSRGGGVLLAFDYSLVITELNLDHLLNIVPQIDVLGCRVSKNHISFNIFVVYIPPYVTCTELELFLEAFEQVTINLAPIIILGDFNLPFLESTNVKTIALDNFIQFNNIKQYNNITNINGGLLDLVMADVPCLVALDPEPLVTIDNYHPALNISVFIENDSDANFPTTASRMRNFKKANYHGLYISLCNIDWSFLTSCSDPNVACNLLYDTLNRKFDEFVPFFKNKTSKYPVWYSHALIQNIKLKNHYHQLLKKFNFNYYRSRFKELRSLVKKQIKESFEVYLNSIENKIQHDPKTFWSFINQKRSSTRIPGKMTFNGINYQNPQEIINCFASYFKSVYTPSTPLITDETSINLPNISISTFSETEIIKSMKRLKNSHTAGHDMIPSFLVRDCAIVLASPLLIIFNMILRTGVFPNCWKLSRICPVHKSGNIEMVSNYRPIAIIPNFAKVFEMCLYENIFPNVKTYLTSKQHGFMPKRSTVTNLAIFSQFTAAAIDSRSQVDVIYTDFSKAFDKLDHSVLLKKLSLFGFSDLLVKFWTSYLVNRRQFVGYNGFRSESFFVTSGVPQGSNLGPLLFSIFINDLPDVLKSESLLFADDLKIYREVKDISDCLLLQNDVDSVSKWCDFNKLHLNISKCKVATFSLKSNPVHFDYSVSSQVIERCTIIRDLGVYFDQKFSFSEHIRVTSKSAVRSLGFLLRNCNSFKNIMALKTLYVALVRSKLDYCNLIWHPCYNAHHKSLESVQRKFLKFLAFRIDGIYPPRGYDQDLLLNRFSMVSLKLRWNICSLDFLIKLFYNKIDSPELLSMVPIFIPRISSRTSLDFYLFARTNVLLKSPIFIMCGNFNKIADLCDINFDNFTTIANAYSLLTINQLYFSN